MKNKVFLVAILVLVLVFVGCGKSEEAKGEAKEEAKTEEESKPVAKVENSMTFSSQEVSGEGFTLSYVEAKKHNMQAGDKKYAAMIIQLANYDSGGGSWHPSPKENGQCRVTVNFSAPSGQELKAGTYNVTGKMAEESYLSVGIEGMVDGKIKSVGLYNGQGTGEIISIDDKTITAKIDVKDEKGTTIKATFTTAYTKSAF
jgi:Tfp pilus assembly protein PilP